MSRFTSRLNEKSIFVSVKLFNVIVALVAFSLLIWSGVSHDHALNMVWLCKLTET